MKLGIMGTGMIVKDLLTISSYLKGVEMTAICNVRRTTEDIREFANSHSIPFSFNNFNDFLTSEIDTVYVALPNNLHYYFTKLALEAGKHVIVEKPFTTTYEEALTLATLARDRQLFLFEAITNQYLPNYLKLKEVLPTIGNLRIVMCNYSQYSSRYNSFKEGIILPAFDPAFAGGALMDLNIYNIHYMIGLFGKPQNVAYYPNMNRGIDTSGILIMEYDTFVGTCIGAKDCKAPITNTIQGDNGCIVQISPTNTCLGFEIQMNQGIKTVFNENTYDHRMVNEFIAFEDMITNNKLKECYKMLNHTLTVSEVLTKAREMAGLNFPKE